MNENDESKKQVRLLTFAQMNELRAEQGELPISVSDLKFYKRELTAIAWVCDCTREEMVSICNMLLPDIPENPGSDEYPDYEDEKASKLDESEQTEKPEQEPEPEPKPEPKQEPKQESNPEPKQESNPEPQIKPKTGATGVVQITPKKTTKPIKTKKSTKDEEKDK